MTSHVRSPRPGPSRRRRNGLRRDARSRSATRGAARSPVGTGRVSAIHVANDGLVKPGDILIELDPSAAEADIRAAEAQLLSADAESLRRREAIAAAHARSLSPPPAIVWPEGVSPSLRAREERVLAADLGQLAAVIASSEAQKIQKVAERDMLKQTIAT